MHNKAMESSLAQHQALDVLSIGKEILPGLYELDKFVENKDYCDASKEYWIWSIGRHKQTGKIYAAIDSRFYLNNDYDCLWLR